MCVYIYNHVNMEIYVIIFLVHITTHLNGNKKGKDTKQNLGLLAGFNHSTVFTFLLNFNLFNERNVTSISFDYILLDL